MFTVKLEKIMGHEKEGTVGKITVAAGQMVKTGDVLFNVECSKGNVKIKSDHAGVVEKVLIEEGQPIKLGDDIFALEGEAPAGKTVAGVSAPHATSASVGSATPKVAYSFGLAKPKKEVIECDIAIIGGGPGGYVAAIRGAQLGASVVLIEKDRLGGTCLNYGCIPTKALVKSAHLYSEMLHAAHFGIRCDNVTPDMPRIIERKDEVVDTLVGGISYLLEHWGVRHIHGEAKAIVNTGANTTVSTEGNPATFKVSDKKQDIEVIAKDIILATGSVPMRLPIPGADLPNVITSEEALQLKDIPKSMTIIGGGIIGMEFAFIYNALGTQVTVVEFAPRILAVLDEDVSDCILDSCQKAGIRVVTSACAERIVMADNGKLITEFSAGGEKRYALGDHVLMAVGRKANLNAVDLEAMGVALNDRKNGVAVDERLRTSAANTYAIGDLTNIIQLAHVASHQGMVAVENIMGKDAIMSYDVIPSAVFTTPEIGTVGKTEEQLKGEGTAYRMGKFPFAANGKAQTQGETDGFVKVLTDMDDRIIGVAIIGPGATDMMSGFAQFIAGGVKGVELAHTVFAHPTTAEAIHEAVLALKGESIHYA